MPPVKTPAIKAPTVSLYIRITDERGRRHYERVRPRSPQLCGPRDNYALLYYVPRMTWEQVGQDFNEAVRCRGAKEQELFLSARSERERFPQPDAIPTSPSSLEELRNAIRSRELCPRPAPRLASVVCRGFPRPVPVMRHAAPENASLPAKHRAFFLQRVFNHFGFS